MSSVMRRKDTGLIGHGDAPVLREGCEPLISRQDAPSCRPIGRITRRSDLSRERFGPMNPERTLTKVLRFLKLPVASGLE